MGDSSRNVVASSSLSPRNMLIIHQDSPNDCGIFICAIAEMLSRCEIAKRVSPKFNFSQSVLYRFVN
jgi:hypothetical protein